MFMQHSLQETLLLFTARGDVWASTECHLLQKGNDNTTSVVGTCLLAYKFFHSLHGILVLIGISSNLNNTFIKILKLDYLTNGEWDMYCRIE